MITKEGFRFRHSIVAVLGYCPVSDSDHEHIIWSIRALVSQAAEEAYTIDLHAFQIILVHDDLPPAGIIRHNVS